MRDGNIFFYLFGRCSIILVLLTYLHMEWPFLSTFSAVGCWILSHYSPDSEKHIEGHLINMLSHSWRKRKKNSTGHFKSCHVPLPLIKQNEFIWKLSYIWNEFVQILCCILILLIVIANVISLTTYIISDAFGNLSNNIFLCLILCAHVNDSFGFIQL